MKLEEIEKEWAQDAPLSETKLASEAARVPILHSKYYAIMIRELFELKRTENELKIAEKNRHLFYSDILTDDELRNFGWARIDYKVLKSDIGLHMSADPELIKSRLKYTLQDEKVSFLKSILSSVGSRGYLIKSMIDWKKFEAGG